MLRIAAIALLLLALAPAVAAADGRPDRSFGQGGALSFAPQEFSSAAGVAIDAQGRTLVGAMLEDGSMLRTRAAVLRLLPNGSLDSAFGSGGVATIAAPDPYRTLRAETMAIDPRGRLVFAGEVDENTPAIWRVLPGGALDPAFGSGGMVIARGAYGLLPAWWWSLAFDGSKIIVAGETDNGPPFGTGLGRLAVAARLDDNGVPDPMFANGGFLILPSDGVEVAGGIAAGGDGRILMGTWHASGAGIPNDGAEEVIRLTPGGALDPSFGSAGRVVLGYAGGVSVAIKLRPSGAIVATGSWSHTRAITPQPPVIAAQLLPSGRMDASFGKGGELIAPSRLPLPASALDCQGDLLMAGTARVLRFGPDGRLDPTFKGTGIPPVAVGATRAAAMLGYFAFAASGSIVLAGSAVDGPSVIGGTSPSGHYAIALARLTATCPVVDTRPPTVSLTCSAGCRRVTGAVVDDPVGGGVRRVLLGVERIDGSACSAWNGKRLVPLACRGAARTLVAVPVSHGTFRVPRLGSGRMIVRAVGVDRAGNRSRPAALRVTI